MGVLTSQPRTASVKCLTNVEVARLDAKTVLEVIDSHPAVLRALLREIVGKVKTSQQMRVHHLSNIHKAREALSKCVSAEVLDTYLDRYSPEQLLSGRNSQVAILFYDIKGFSAAAEKLKPRTLLKTLNEHLEIIVNNIARERGVVINFIGDAVLAAFNCPLELDNPADAALRCYLASREEMRRLHVARRQQGLRCFQLGAGLTFGSVVSGAIGTEDRFNFTILGDEVNLAARLESLTRQYPVELIMSDSFYGHLSSRMRSDCLLFDRVQVKGRKRPVELYTIPWQAVADRKAFTLAVRSYLKGQFRKASDRFTAQRGNLAGYLGARCKSLRDRNALWSGYFPWESK